MNDDENNHMVLAFVLLNTQSERTESILNLMRTNDKIKEAYIIYGDWDILIKIEVESLPELTKLVMSFRKEDGIKKTSTLITVQDF